jgi:hypothetical protein
VQSKDAIVFASSVCGRGSSIQNIDVIESFESWRRCMCALPTSWLKSIGFTFSSLGRRDRCEIGKKVSWAL